MDNQKEQIETLAKAILFLMERLGDQSGHEWVDKPFLEIRSEVSKLLPEGS